MTEITMPRLSDSMEEGTILTWLKANGDTITKDEELVEIETDKATMTYESPEAGTLTIIATEGTTLPIGAVIATIGVTADAPPPAPAPAAPPAHDPAPEPAAAQAPSPVAVASAPASNGPIHATPLARRLAAAHGVDLAAARGSGPRGRVTRGDVAAAAGIELQGEPAAGSSPVTPAPVPEPAPAAGPAPPVDSIGAKGTVTIQQPTRIQQVIARRMAETKATVPDFQVQTDVRMDAAIELRNEFKALGGDVVPSLNDLIVKASALALRDWPRANASYKDGRFELYSRINIGIAVAAHDALVVPTITDADTRSIGSIATEARRLADRVRSGEITPPELSGATFTVSNLGMYGMTAITSVINSPKPRSSASAPAVPSSPAKTAKSPNTNR